MNTPTETPTPRVDAKIKHYYPTTHPHERPEEVVEADFARDFERELAAVSEANARLNLELADEQARLAAVTKERDDARNAHNKARYDLCTVQGIRDGYKKELREAKEQLAEANADRARLREALDRLPHHPNCNLMQRSPLSTAAREKWQEKGCTCFKAALSTPPPPVVPIMDLFAKMVRELTHSGYIWNESIDRLKELAAKHPTSNLTSRGDVAG
jgi:hypothetical protein